ncbi:MULTISPECIES: CRTAC1 family protein [unclassified Spirosoma]|uniref:CRTAC1 family protein n=1 Tax=unclassified Spirosoma TaxID=2621999 RepID=UPI000AC5FB25|nr:MULTISPECIES: CRTAC1 family protein [unclassified Spirosoma]
MRIPLSTLLLTMMIATSAHRIVYGQISFVNATDKLPERPFVGFLSKAVVDLDGDGLDDIVRTHSRTQQLSVLTQSSAHAFSSTLLSTLGREPIATLVGDVDKDHRNDLLTAGFYDGVTVRRNQSNGWLADTINSPKIWMQGANLVDIDNDGWLDIFGCNDVGLNQIWKNNAQGTFAPVTNWIDMRTVPASDNSGNYGSVWSDIDNDGDLDLYLAKCSMYAMGPANAGDPRRINQLFINHTYDRINGQLVKNTTSFSTDPTNWFSEAAAGANVKISGQSWTADFADIDNDGDQDLLITNHESPTMLLENDGTGHFTDITTQSGIANVLEPLQGLMRDFDNDGYVDVLVTGDMAAQLWRNNGNKTFTLQTGALGTIKTTSFALGDLNHDGFLDVYTSHYPRADAEDDLWLGAPNGNHFLGVTLQGMQSNSNGVGAKIVVYRSDGVQLVREVRSGESYGITNSYTQLIGLGPTASISRVEVQWPSGQRSRLDTPASDQFMVITEPICSLSRCVPIKVSVLR